MKNILSALFVMSTLALTAFGAGFTVTQPIKAGSIQLKPGEYKFEMQGEKLVFKEGRTVVAEVPATTETAAKKYADTTYESSNGQIMAIRVGGTTTRIVLK
ncbi:MAG: hypothetical protein WDO18_10195 [Acidobacteriota bacterium]